MADNWEIKTVVRENAVVKSVTVIFKGEEYSYILKDKKIICTSERKLDEKDFTKERREQLYAILSRGLPNRRIKGKSKDENERLENLAAFRCYVLDNGKLVISFNREGTLQPSTYQDINSAIRAQDHIQDNYLGGDEETSEIFRLFSNLEVLTIVRKVLFDWKTASPQEISHAENILLKTAKNLKRCVNQLKKSAAWQLNKSVDFTDSTGKKNPGAILARTCAADSRLEERTTEIRGIDQHVSGRKAALILEKRQMELNIVEAMFKLKMILHSPDKFFENKKIADQRLGEVMYFLQSVWLNPFLLSAKDAKKDILEAKTKISKNEISQAKKFISRAISTLQSIQ